MAFRPIVYKGRLLSVHKATVAPSFDQRTVLVTSTWDYVALWLRRQRKSKALFFWDQARHFNEATTALPPASAPLTAYYCFLNAVKALLVAKGTLLAARPRHGVAGSSTGTKASLANENVEVAPGVLADLCRFLNEPLSGTYTLKDILYNLAYIHRAYTLTFRADAELFIPIKNPMAVRSNANNEAWFCAELEDRYATMRTMRTLPSQYERDIGADATGNTARGKRKPGRFVIRTKRRFDWNPRAKSKSLDAYRAYHARIRRDLQYIHSAQRLWYLKRRDTVRGYIPRGSLTLTFMAMHRLSELGRYEPELLNRHLEGQHNWLLTEFISIAPRQFIDEISSELTGLEFMSPGSRKAG
jgi:hypothetical protein